MRRIGISTTEAGAAFAKSVGWRSKCGSDNLLSAPHGEIKGSWHEFVLIKLIGSLIFKSQLNRECKVITQVPRNSDCEAAYQADAKKRIKCRSGERESIDAEHLSVHSVGIRNSKPPHSRAAAKPPHFSSRKIAKTPNGTAI